MVEQEVPQERRRFVIVQPANAFIEKAQIKAQRPDGITVDEQITRLIAIHSLSPQEVQGGQPEYLVFDATQDQFLRAAKEALTSPNSSTVRDCFESLVLIAPEAKTTSSIVDKTTGIRIINIKKGEIRFPTHPTPAS